MINRVAFSRKREPIKKNFYAPGRSTIIIMKILIPLITKGLIRSYPRSLNAQAPMIITSGIALATLSKHLPVSALWAMARGGYNGLLNLNLPLIGGWVNGFVVPMLKHGPNAVALYSTLIERIGYVTLGLRICRHILSAGILWPARAIAGILGIEWINPSFLPLDIARWAKSSALSIADFAHENIETIWSHISPDQIGWTAWILGSILGFSVYAYNCVGSDFVQMVCSIPYCREFLMKPLAIIGAVIQESTLCLVLPFFNWAWSGIFYYAKISFSWIFLFGWDHLKDWVSARR